MSLSGAIMDSHTLQSMFFSCAIYYLVFSNLLHCSSSSLSPDLSLKEAMETRLVEGREHKAHCQVFKMRFVAPILTLYYKSDLFIHNSQVNAISYYFTKTNIASLFPLTQFSITTELS